MIAKNFKFLCKHFKDKQTVLAKMFHVSQSDISYYQNGKKEIPIDILNKISVRYNVSIDDLTHKDLSLDYDLPQAIALDDVQNLGVNVFPILTSNVAKANDNFNRAYEKLFETLQCDDVKILYERVGIDLNDEKYSILHWLSILLENREFDIPSALAQEAKEYISNNFKVDYKKYDIIIGYRADDSYFSFAQDFINGTISYRQLNNAMHLGNLGQQFVLKSKKAFDEIKFIKYEIAENSIWYEKKEARDKAARREYFDVEKNKRQRGDIYITQIMDEEMKADDERLR